MDERVEPLPSSCVPFHPPPLFLISSCCYSAFLAFRLFLLLDRLTTTNFLRVIKNWADIFLWAVCVITGSDTFFSFLSKRTSGGLVVKKKKWDLIHFLRRIGKQNAIYRRDPFRSISGMRLSPSSLPVLALEMCIWMCIKRRAKVKEGFGPATRNSDVAVLVCTALSSFRFS